MMEDVDHLDGGGAMMEDALGDTIEMADAKTNNSYTLQSSTAGARLGLQRYRRKSIQITY